MWRWYKGKYGLAAEVLTLGKVRGELPHLPPYRLVLVDESHNLRNREGRRYRAIAECVWKCSGDPDLSVDLWKLASLRCKK